jgi:hypothetical protein
VNVDEEMLEQDVRAARELLAQGRSRLADQMLHTILCCLTHGVYRREVVPISEALAEWQRTNAWRRRHAAERGRAGAGAWSWSEEVPPSPPGLEERLAADAVLRFRSNTTVPPGDPARLARFAAEHGMRDGAAAVRAFVEARRNGRV